MLFCNFSTRESTVQYIYIYIYIYHLFSQRVCCWWFVVVGAVVLERFSGRYCDFRSFLRESRETSYRYPIGKLSNRYLELVTREYDDVGHLIHNNLVVVWFV